MKDSIMDPVMEKKAEAKELIHTIMEMPNTDELPLIRQLAIHLHRLLRIRVITPPISEVMITLQTEKTKLYHATRLSLPDKSHLSILFEINGDAHLAKERLQSFLND